MRQVSREPTNAFYTESLSTTRVNLAVSFLFSPRPKCFLMEIKNLCHYRFQDKDLMSAVYKPGNRQMETPSALGGLRSFKKKIEMCVNTIFSSSS